MTDTPETDAAEWGITPHNMVVRSGLARKLERERDEAIRSCYIWQKGHSDIVTERDLWQQEADRWRNMYIQYEELLEGQIQEAVARLNKVWVDLDRLKKKVQDDLRED